MLVSQLYPDQAKDLTVLSQDMKLTVLLYVHDLFSCILDRLRV